MSTSSLASSRPGHMCLPKPNIGGIGCSTDRSAGLVEAVVPGFLLMSPRRNRNGQNLRGERAPYAKAQGGVCAQYHMYTKRAPGPYVQTQRECLSVRLELPTTLPRPYGALRLNGWYALITTCKTRGRRVCVCQQHNVTASQRGLGTQQPCFATETLAAGLKAEPWSRRTLACGLGILSPTQRTSLSNRNVQAVHWRQTRGRRTA